MENVGEDEHLLCTERRLIALVLLLFVSLGLSFIALRPPFEAPDEVWHFAYARYVSQRADLPVQGARQGEELAHQEASQPPLYYLLAAPLVRLIDASDFEAVARLNPHAAPGLPHSDGNKNMVVPAGDAPLRGTLLAVLVLRCFSLLLGGVTVVSTWLLACRIWSATNPFVALSRRRDSSHARWLPLLCVAVVAFNPQFVFISSSINNDNLMTALATVAVTMVIHMATDPPPLRLSGRRLALLGVVCGLAALSKLTGLLLLGFAIIGVAAAFWRRRAAYAGTNVALSLIRAVTIIAGLALLIAGWWYARNWMLYRDVAGLGPMLQWVGQRSLSLADLWAEMEGLELSFWAVFGWFNILVENGVYTVFKLAVRAAALGLILLVVRQVFGRPVIRAQSLPAQSVSELTDETADPLALSLCALWAAMVMAGLLRWTATTPGTQGRLLFPAIGALAVLIVCGLAALAPGRLRLPILAGLAAALMLFAFIVPWRYIVPAYARPPVDTSGQAAIQRPVHYRYGEEDVELVGYSLDRERVMPGQTLAVTLYYQALRPMTNDYSLFIHLWGRDMEWLGQRDSYPGRGSLPTSQMTPGRIIEDRYLISVPATATVPARIRLEIGFYNFDTGRRLWATTPESKRIELPFVGRLKLAGTEAVAAAVTPDLTAFGEQIALVAAQVDAPPVVQAGDVITVATTWQALAPMAQDYTVFMQLVDQTPTVLAQNDGEPQGGEYPTGLWDQGEIVTDRRTLTIPVGLAAGRYRLVAGLYLLGAPERLPVRGPSGPVPENWVVVGEVATR